MLMRVDLRRTSPNQTPLNIHFLNEICLLEVYKSQTIIPHPNISQQVIFSCMHLLYSRTRDHHDVHCTWISTTASSFLNQPVLKGKLLSFSKHFKVNFPIRKLSLNQMFPTEIKPALNQLPYFSYTLQWLLIMRIRLYTQRKLSNVDDSYNVYEKIFGLHVKLFQLKVWS